MKTLRIVAKITLALLFTFTFPPQVTFSAPKAQTDFQKLETLMGASKFDAVIELTRKLELRYPQKKAELFAERATAYLYKGDKKSARLNAEKSLLVDSKNHEAHWVLSNVLMSQGESDKGMEEYQLSLRYPSKKVCKPCAAKLNKFLVPAKFTP